VNVETESASAQEKPVSVNDLIIYHAGNTSGVRHLARPSDGESLCGKVELDYNREGFVKGTKSSEFKGCDRVLGSVCSLCENVLQEIKGEQQ